MERRLAIKQILIAAGGLVLLPSCLKHEGKSSILLSRIDVSATQEKILAEIAEVIIPKTDTPGAKDLNLHLYVLKMLDDCYEKEEQDKFFIGLGYFKDLDQQEIKALVIAANSEKDDVPKDLYPFYNLMKQRTISGYMNSKYVMSNLVIWELVPGRYNGYFPVKTA
ncbi:gluconate 2-dehydrogenase subunit 3 family protein [Pedobacter metabolipauper]|uniref:Gluconate 2-dehydrogenase subunit 3-like protein n=1 Tax=Pedobacter metabolipauper TaxID=425513 RepID=A0A4R6T1R8_9SPHI|nr:gluconate 2-dehydrogenase subunit 3 family protein [Pedobacter metabolipauper]TDQ11608.1 gluconate 2-dehydrogenase subunit 3-like protein [Pedobacter metabolipauper]